MRPSLKSETTLMIERQTGKHKQRPPTYVTRRKALLAIGGAASAGVLLSCGGGSDDTTASSSSTTSSTSSTSTTTTSTDASTCAVTPEGEIGPYFVDDSATGFDRADIRSNLDGSETQTGIPLTLTITVQDSESSCIGLQGAQVDIWDCNAGGNQEWTPTAARELRVYGGTMCLDAYNNQTSAGTKVELWSCNGGANQQWALNPDGTITGVQSGLCLDVTGGNVPAGNVNGTDTELWTCNGGANQQWAVGA